MLFVLIGIVVLISVLSFLDSRNARKREKELVSLLIKHLPVLLGKDTKLRVDKSTIEKDTYKVDYLAMDPYLRQQFLQYISALKSDGYPIKIKIFNVNDTKCFPSSLLSKEKL